MFLGFIKLFASSAGGLTIVPECGASGVPVKVVWEEPVTLLNESVPVEQLFVSLPLVPHHGGRHVVAPAGGKPTSLRINYSHCSSQMSYVKSLKAQVTRKKNICLTLLTIKVLDLTILTIVTQEQCLQAGWRGCSQGNWNISHILDWRWSYKDSRSLFKHNTFSCRVTWLMLLPTNISNWCKLTVATLLLAFDEHRTFDRSITTTLPHYIYICFLFCRECLPSQQKTSRCAPIITLLPIQRS